jgi:hypothetical protein
MSIVFIVCSFTEHWSGLYKEEDKVQLLMEQIN